ncbi:hypothetical protein [Paenibacillus sp. GCM10027626]|uniref:RICIN domain-containing protein n=1 Tax=Paenibacillus sp. GCM10027626 TaxID=3273411 RepID=UPI00362DA291
MKFHRLHITLCCIVLVFSLLPLSGQAAGAGTGSTLSVNLENVIQENFLGLGGTYHGFAYMPESSNKGMTADLRNLEFDRVSGAGLKIARTWYGSDWAMPSWGGSYNWNSARMTAFYNWLQAMKDRQVDVALQVGWWFSKHTCTNSDADCVPTEADVDTYTRWVSDSIQQLVNVKGFSNVKYLILFTEPGDYCGCGGLPPGYTQLTFYNHVVNKLHQRLVDDGRRSLVKLVGPNATSLSNNRVWLQNAVQNLNSAIDIYSSHDYNLGGYEGWNAITASSVSDIAATGKPFWLDEYGLQQEAKRELADYGTYIAEANAGAINAGAQSTLIWLYQDQYYVPPLQNLSNNDSFYNGLHKWGTMPWLPASIQPRPHYQAFALMAKFLGGAGTKVFRTTGADNLRITATRLPDGNYTVMVVNSNTAARSFTVNFSSVLNRNFRKHLYDPASVPAGDAVVGASAVFSSVGTSFADTIPARGVAIYTTVNDGSAIGLSGDYRWINRQSGLALHNAGGIYNGIAGTANVAAAPAGWNMTEQAWTIAPAGNGLYTIRSKANPNLLLQDAGDPYSNVPETHRLALTPASWNLSEQLWKIVDTGDGYYKLINMRRGTKALQDAGGIYDQIPGTHEVSQSPLRLNTAEQQWQLTAP